MKTIDFMKNKNMTILLSALLILGTLFTGYFNGFNYSIDFKGGVVTELRFKEDIKSEEINNILKSDFEELTVFNSGSSKVLEIQTPLVGDYKNAGQFIFNKVKNVTKYKEVELLKSEFIGPKVGNELKTNGILALAIVVLSVLIYTSLRFELKFAVGAILALVHDIFITIGFISLFKVDVDLTVLAALLAILGYSLNDTIVVYDRIRENFQRMEKSEVYDIINKSLNETLSRTIMTSLTTAVALLAIFIFAGEGLKSFSTVLLFGVFIGTYSSVYVASSSLLALKVNKQQFKKEKIDTKNGVI